MSTRPLAEHHAVVTGGSRGIGRAIARALLDAGARVTITGRDPSTLDAAAVALAAHGGIHAVPCDVSDGASVVAAFADARAHFGPVHILVNNAGQAASQAFARTDEALWNRMLTVNLTGAFRCTQSALPDLLAAGHGRVVNVASTAALKGYAYVAAYCAAKHGLLGLTRALAQELAAKGITVNAVCPGYTETDIVREAVAGIVAKTGRTPEQARAELVKSNPQGRLVTPEQVARTVAWLCLPGSDAINGQAIGVDGGEA
jgi:3-hydroxybutyrate dehydrogenase